MRQTYKSKNRQLLYILFCYWPFAVLVYGETTSQGFYITPYLQNPSTDAITIMWETHQPSIGLLEYCKGKENPRYELKSLETEKTKIHKIRISGLQADTEYAYRVKAGNAVHHDVFKTKPAKSNRVRFVIIGDDKNWRTYWETSRLPQHLSSHQPEFILILGDLANNGLKYKDWPQHWRRWTSIMGHIPIIPCRGNHERDGREDPENDWFAKYHDLPGGEPLTSFDWGPAHFAMISFTHWKQAPDLFDKDLSTTDKKWKILGTHYPVYGTGYFSPTDRRKMHGFSKLEAVFDKHHVDMYAAGHNHMYERCFAMRAGQRDDNHGTLYLIQGGQVEGNYPDRWSAKVAKQMDWPHYTLIEITEDIMELWSYGLAPGERNKRMKARIIEFDHYIRWRDESKPKALLAKLDHIEGTELIAAIERLGAMMYAPAASAINQYLTSENQPLCRTAGAALENIAGKDIAVQLLPHLNHPDVAIQNNIARSLEAAMPAELADRIAPLALDKTRKPRVRARLLGALLLHAPAELSCKIALQTLDEKNKAIRHRAVDVVKRTAGKKDIPVLIAMFEKELDDHVAVSLGWGLNRLTGARVNLEKVKKSKPGKRQPFIDKWRQAI
ncbi:MAG: metallophosphoesterase family protein [Planctomycetota bacterium]|nr:MAG: metallophosphoesterase family protein [Planctomycetota bacterium]